MKCNHIDCCEFASIKGQAFFALANFECLAQLRNSKATSKATKTFGSISKRMLFSTSHVSKFVFKARICIFAA